MKTVLQMLRERGYVVTDDEIAMTMEGFTAKYGDNMKREDLMLVKAKRDSGEKIYVFFPEEAKVGAKTIRTLISRMNDDNVTRAILVSQQNLTPANKMIKEVAKIFQVEVFQVTDPVARYHGLKSGDVVKIICPSETAGRYITYRYAV
ncbi:hypothetical protein SASPL_113196 [Salvia splendens]|uniref:DNA-directed RNA polymerases I, II, and III subunit RPABC1 n=1 Tax=Salvia splendens TaxID=180675 RepID=A0A8X8XZK3_SALSN|nr:hypothetical protein SASPL_113196 [Salvia splendens]